MTSLLIDSNYLGYQAAFTHKNLRDSKGRPSGVIYGFLSRVLSLGLMFKTNHFIFCWDSKQSIRKLIYPSYKERTKNLTIQELSERALAGEAFLSLRKDILPRIGFKNQYHHTGYESDDLLARMIESWIGDYVIITGDADLYQLLYGCRIYHPSKNKMMTMKKLQSEYNVTPAEWVLIKQIAGCTSDNVKGIVGVGEKTAIKYIRNTLKKESKAYEAIKKNPELISFNKQLVKLPYPGCKIKPTSPNSFSLKEFQKLCKEYDFESFIDDVNIKNWETFFKGSFDYSKPVISAAPDLSKNIKRRGLKRKGEK